MLVSEDAWRLPWVAHMGKETGLKVILKRGSFLFLSALFQLVCLGSFLRLFQEFRLKPILCSVPEIVFSGISKVRSPSSKKHLVQEHLQELSCPEQLPRKIDPSRLVSQWTVVPLCKLKNSQRAASLGN